MTKTKSQKLSGLYAITDPDLMQENIITKVEQAILGGINILQYRNKTASPVQQLQEANELAQLCKSHNVLFIINDNIELALQVDADGLHLGQTDTPLLEARQRLPENKIIGVSCNNKIEMALIAQKHGADYIAFGRFYKSITKPEAPQAELSLLSEARNKIIIPIVAIGGISPEAAPALIKEGVSMIAAINGIFAQDDVYLATQRYVKAIKQNLNKTLA